MSEISHYCKLSIISFENIRSAFTIHRHFTMKDKYIKSPSRTLQTQEKKQLFCLRVPRILFNFNGKLKQTEMKLSGSSALKNETDAHPIRLS